MNNEPLSAPNERFRRRLARLLIVLAGLVLSQAVLYGPCLLGQKVLLPLDILAHPGFYLPRTPATAQIETDNLDLLDLVCAFEPARRFGAAEFRAGRLPMWMPFQFSGAPFVFPKFSPFFALEFCTASPVILAWAQLAAALVAGLGAYLFFRRVLDVSFWPATIAAWCYPLTAFFIFWQGYQTGNSVYWFPWLLLAVDGTVRRRWRFAPVGLSLVTCLVLISGHLDVAGQVLLASGLYALWCLYDAHNKIRRLDDISEIKSEIRNPKSETNSNPEFPKVQNVHSERGVLNFLLSLIRICFGFRISDFGFKRAFAAASRLSLAWLLGFLLASPHLLPALDYTRTGARVARRTVGQADRPPIGLSALPQVVLPEMYGAYWRHKAGSFRYARDSQVESSAAAYAGVTATLVLAPLAWCSRRHRRWCLVWTGLCVFALSWCLNIPGFVQLLRLPVLNLMSHNRLVFIAGFGILALSAIGLEVFLRGPVQWRWWLCVPGVLLSGLCAWCVYRACVLPEPMASRLGRAVQAGQQFGWLQDADGVRRVQAWFVAHYAAAAVLCGLGLLAWLVIRGRWTWQSRLLPGLGALVLGDLLWFGYGKSPQSDPALYFPPVPVLEQVAKANPDRVIGYYTLPAALAGMCGLRDVRGYDAVDPSRMVELLKLAADPSVSSPDYASTMYLLPNLTPTPAGEIRLPPVLNMLGVRFVIFRGEPLAGTRPVFQGPDYWVLTNEAVLPRVLIPQRVECVPDNAVRLKKLGSDDFDPRSVAYVEAPVSLPDLCRGRGEIVTEISTRVKISVRMETPGLVVLADHWDSGWHAYLEGKRVPILRTNHALRGVVVRAGTAMLEFRYEPASFAWGLRLAAGAALVLVGWKARIAFARSRG